MDHGSFPGGGGIMSKTALVTGSTRGIGLGIARALGHEGYRVILCGRREKPAVEDVLASLQDRDIEATYIRADLSIAEDRANLLARSKGYSPQLNVLVNNAGMAPRQRSHILDATEESFEEVLKVNLQAPYFLTQQCAHWMIESKKENPAFNAAVVNINSVSSTLASTSRGEYCISKAGLSMATKLWAVALSDHGIPVYELRPGLIATDMTSGVKQRYDELIKEGLLLQPRWGTAEDIGKAVASLVRGDIPYATGQVLIQDGGLTLARL